MRAKNIPERRYDKTNRRWLFKPLQQNIEYVKEQFPDAIWSEEAQQEVQRVLERVSKREHKEQLRDAEFDLSPLDNVSFRLPPFLHQKRALLLGRDEESFAYLMDQGTGKTKVLLDDAAHNFRQNRIDGLVIICPNSVKTNWVNNDPSPVEPDEVDKHMAPDVPYAKYAWNSNTTKTQREQQDEFFFSTDRSKLDILSVNVEGLAHDRITAMIAKFVAGRRCMIVVDESTRIKNRTAKRTKAAIKLRQNCILARILSGTSVIKSPLDAYSQFQFLDPEILGFASFTGFRNHHCIMGGWQNKQVQSYIRLPELSSKIAGASYRVLKEDCLDLPPKLYQRRSIAMSDAQRRAYNDMRRDSIAVLERYTKEEGRIVAPVVLTQMLRLQQITAGFLPILDEEGKQIDVAPIGETNPKIEEALSILEETSGKVIIWCRFKSEVRELAARCEKEGHTAVSFYGEISEDERIKARSAFQSDPRVKVFIGTASAGGIGLNLWAATTVIYLTNSFSTEERVQSEDRAHRIGQEHPVTYIDLVCPGTVDVRVLQTLRANKRISEEVMRDNISEWI